MINNLDNQSGSIKRFVRNTLGCTCPDKVFEQIEDKIVLSSASPHTRSITIGNRLLIYIWKVDTSGDLQPGISAMLGAGKEEREARGLNRFRAVLAVENPQTILPQANLCLSRFKDSDDRIHIHVVPVDSLKEF